MSIAEFGGSDGVRDRGLLEAALARPLASFGGELLYPTPFMRAAALLESLVRNHGFIDGNKRVAIMTTAFWLEREGFAIEASQDELYEKTMQAAQGQLTLDAIAAWLEASSAPLVGPGRSLSRVSCKSAAA